MESLELISGRCLLRPACSLWQGSIVIATYLMQCVDRTIFMESLELISGRCLLTTSLQPEKLQASVH